MKEKVHLVAQDSKFSQLNEGSFLLNFILKIVSTGQKKRAKPILWILIYSIRSLFWMKRKNLNECPETDDGKLNRRDFCFVFASSASYSKDKVCTKVVPYYLGQHHTTINLNDSMPCCILSQLQTQYNHLSVFIE